MTQRRFPPPLVRRTNAIFDLDQTTSFCDPLSFMHGRSRKEFVMQTTTKMILAICCIGAVAVETLTPVYAQHRHRTWNGCPRGMTVQGGRCAPYRWAGGPYWGGGWNNNWGGGWNNNWGGGWNTFNGCPPGFTIQGGNCAPYRWGR